MTRVELKQPYTTLLRGGYLIDTAVGYIQFGAPPETIKDTMAFPKSSPQIFVLPNKFFHKYKGISVAELEFPLYYNHFLRQLKTTVICTAEQKEQLLIVLNESVFGPDIINLRSEFSENEKSSGFPDMQAEMDYFRGNRTLEDLVEFQLFEENQVKIEGVTIRKMDDGNFQVEDSEGEGPVEIPGEIGFNIVYDTGARLPEPFQPPLLGITCLGPSHGFDPEENTSGFLLWINHSGIMVDPPVNSTEWLRGANVNPRAINSIILTHCHADHDAGTFQKILEEGKVTVYTTETVMYSFIRKYNALTQIPIKELLSLFDFVPVIIGKPYTILDAEFNFSYALHSIPSLSFSFLFQDQSFLYSSDHLNDPAKFKEMLDEGILTVSRYHDLMDFPWHHNIIYHEAGIPPLHTRVDYLQTLPEEVQKKITVYHIAHKDLPEASHLTMAKFGIENTLYPPVTPPKHEGAYRILNVLNNLDIFRDFPISRARDFLSLTVEESFKRGDAICKKNTPGDKFFIIVSGVVKVVGADHDGGTGYDVNKRHGSYEYFGEASLILNQPRSADVIAETDITALTIEKTKFLNFIKGSDLFRKFERLSAIRKTGTWDVFSKSRFFQGITSAQATQLELIIEYRKFENNGYLIRHSKTFNEAFILKSGQVEVVQDGKLIETLSAGDFCGEIYKIQKEATSSFDFKAVTDLEVYAVEREHLIKYIAENPGVYMRLNYIYGE